MALTQGTTLALHVDEVLDKASKCLHPSLLDSEEVPQRDGVIVVSLEVLQHGLPKLLPREDLFGFESGAPSTDNACHSHHKHLATMASSPLTNWIVASKLMTKALGSVIPL